jgi:hypothetical protein
MRQRPWTTFFLALVGVGVCVLGVVGFIWAVSTNNLPWQPNKSARDYYREVGDAFGDGFVMGFFLCFFLVLGAVSFGYLLGSAREVVPRREPRDEPRPRFRVLRGRRP